MDNLLFLVMEAHSTERNHHRQYQVRVGKDLFDHWTVRITYGRTGCYGTERCYGSSDPSELIKIVRRKLLLRSSAPKRIGCKYEIVAAKDTESAPLVSWIPEEVLKLL